MISEVNVTSRKESVARVNGPGGSEGGTLRPSLDSKEHLDWLMIDLNVAEIITIQDYKHTKNVNGSTHTQC